MNHSSEQPPADEPKIDYSQLEVADQGDNHTIYVNPATGQRYLEDDEGISEIAPRDPQEPGKAFKTSPYAEPPPPRSKILEAPGSRSAVPFGESKLEKSSYQEAVTKSYVAKRQAVEKEIAEDKLPEDYRLPEEIDSDSLLGRRVATLEAIYERMPTTWQPRVIFYPQGLSVEQWNQLLSGHVLYDRRAPEYRDGKQSQGLYFGISERKVSSDTGINIEATELWDVAVISGAERPSIRGVSPDGSEILDREGDPTKRLAEGLPYLGFPLPGFDYLDDIDRRKVVGWASPAIDTYLGLQLTLLENTEKNVDDLGIVIGKGRELEGSQRVPFTMRWSTENATVNVIPTSPNSGISRRAYLPHEKDARRDYLEWKGIRPTASGRDVVSE